MMASRIRCSGCDERELTLPEVARLAGDRPLDLVCGGERFVVALRRLRVVGARRLRVVLHQPERVEVGWSSMPESWNFRRSRATSATCPAPASPGGHLAALTNIVTRHEGSSNIAATPGAIPSSAAALFAMHSAVRSIPSSSVRLPGRRTT